MEIGACVCYLLILYKSYSQVITIYALVTNPDLEFRLNKIKRKKWMVLVFFPPFVLPLSYCFALSHFLFVFHSQFVCLLWNLLDTSYIWFRDHLNTNQALHAVTDSVTLSQSVMMQMPHSQEPITLQKLLLCVVGMVYKFSYIHFIGCILQSKFIKFQENLNF